MPGGVYLYFSERNNPEIKNPTLLIVNNFSKNLKDRDKQKINKK